MEIPEVVERVEACEAFRAMRKKDPKSYLAHLFSMHAPGAAPEYQVGYFSPKSAKIVVFRAEPAEQIAADEAFNKGEAIKELDPANVRIGQAAAEETAFAVKQEMAPAETVVRIVLVLQHLDRQVFNITLVTALFNILNVRIDAASGEVISKDLRSIMSLRLDEREKA